MADQPKRSKIRSLMARLWLKGSLV